MTLIWVTLAGSAGAVTRFVADGAVRARWKSSFPVATLLINVTGSLLLGFLVGLVTFRQHPSVLSAVLGTGFCGGYTTFSTASFETVRLAQQRRFAPAALNAVGSIALTMLAAAAGLAVGAGAG